MRTLRTGVLFLLLLGFWQALSGRIDPLFIALGIVSSAAVTRLSLPLFEQVIGSANEHPHVGVFKLIRYFVWLLLRIPQAGFHVARVVLDPRIPPRPGVVRFTTTLSSPTARAVLANSITLVPGTMTLAVDGNEFTVHAFTPAAVADLANAATQCRIAVAFNLPPDTPPVMTWEPIHDELPEDPL